MKIPRPILKPIILFLFLIIIGYIFLKNDCPSYIKGIEGCENLSDFLEICIKDINVTYSKDAPGCNAPFLDLEICNDLKKELSNKSIKKNNYILSYGHGCSLRLSKGVAGFLVKEQGYNSQKSLKEISPGDLISYFHANQTLIDEAFNTNNFNKLDGLFLTHRVIYVDNESILTETDTSCKRHIIRRDSYFEKIYKLIILKKYQSNYIFPPDPKFICSGGFLNENLEECNKQKQKYYILNSSGKLPSCWKILPKKTLLDHSIAVK